MTPQGATNTVTLVDFEFRLLVSGTEPNLSGKIHVTNVQKAVIDVVVDCLFAAHQLILMGNVDLVDRMTLFYQWRDNPVEPGDLFLTGRKAAS